MFNAKNTEKAINESAQSKEWRTELDECIINISDEDHNTMIVDPTLAVRLFLDDNIKVGPICRVYPNGLNPFIRAIESLGLERRIMILPSLKLDTGKFNSTYLITKLPPLKVVTSVVCSK